MSHMRKAEIQQLSSGRHVQLPPPRKVSMIASRYSDRMQSPSQPNDSPPGVPSPGVTTASELLSSNLETIDSEGKKEHVLNSNSPAVSTSGANSFSGTNSCDEERSHENQMERGSDTDADSAEDAEISTDIAGLYGSRDFRIYCFMKNHSNLIGVSIKHHTTEALMDDLLKDYCKDDPPDARYRSFKGVKKALFRASGLSTSSHPMCKHSHQALIVDTEGTVMPCNVKGCDNEPRSTRSYEYIELWPQLRGRIQSPSYGPLMFEYFRQGLTSLEEGRDNDYIDFFSGRNFKSILKDLGGPQVVRDDIFLHLSTDGVQPFESGKYSYWPVVLSIANIPPHERYKVQNMLPVMFIPGPNNPKDLPSFLAPLIEELRDLSVHGKLVKMWDGNTCRVRVHLLTVQSDLVALAKLAYLSGTNGIFPCRFCMIQGAYDEGRRHYYYPHGVADYEESGDGSHFNSIDVLCDPLSLPLRSDIDVRTTYKTIQKLLSKGHVREAKELAQSNGLSKEVLRASPLLDIPTIFAFSSFPVDIMHLLYCNISKITVDLWLSSDKDLGDIAVLSSKERFEGVERSMRAAGTGIASASARKPRGLSERGNWKASEWKTFVSTTSLAVLHGWIPDHILAGWSLFCRLCHLVEQWKLTERQVCGIEKLARRFFMHFNRYYYRYRPERLHLCRYVYHLVLHLGDSIRANGPVSMTAQWSMETFVGVMNRRCNAKDLFAESVTETAKLEAASRLYAIQHSMRIPHIDPLIEEESSQSRTLARTSELPELDGFELLHPKFETTISKAEEQFPRLRFLLKKHYQISLDVDSQAADHILDEFDTITVWHRLLDSKAANSVPVTYRSFTERDMDTKERSACYFAGHFFADSDGFVDVWYGKALGFFEHRVGSDVRFLVMAGWVTKGLHCGEQHQVFAKKSRSSTDLFTSVSVESIRIMSHPLSVLECHVPNRNSGLSKRTYFVDELRDVQGFMTGRKWNNEVPGIRLRGLVQNFHKKQERIISQTQFGVDE